MNEVKPHVVVPSRTLADWLDGQPETWWNVDGDPLLTSEIDFPCPNDELAEGFRKHDRNLLIFTKNLNTVNPHDNLRASDLEGLVDTDNPGREKYILAAWSGSDIEWLLSEDKDMAEEARRMAAESGDAKAKN